MAGDTSALPQELRERADAARAALGREGIEWTSSATPGLPATTSTVLSVASLPSTQRELVALFRSWTEQLDIEGEIHLIEQTRDQKRNPVLSALRTRRRNPVTSDRDVVAAIRAVGWTVTAIDRIDVEHQGTPQRWVELRASDVAAQARRTSS